jgi:Cu/Ag efflux protein CusF
MRKETCRRLPDAHARIALSWFFRGFLVFSLVAIGRGQTPSPAYKAIGVVVSIEPTGFTIQADSGNRLTVSLSDHALLLRVAPNQKDLKNATKINAGEISVGDRILVRGRISDDQKTLFAAAAIVMSKADITRKQEAERADWQKRGVGGLVSSVDPATSTITISTGGAIKKVIIHMSKDTVLRRYAADSVRFDDAKPAKLDEIKAGDQLRARGTRSEDGSEFTAEEIVSGSFRNIAGTVSSIDAGQSTISVTDLKTKKPVLVKVTSDSQLRKLPPMMAQRIAMRLKGDTAGGPPNGAGGGAPATAQPAGAPPSGGGPGGPRPGGAPDLQQILNRMPPATLADLQKGDAVMIVATEGTASGAVTAITLLGGVEAILASSGSASQAMFMSPWNLGGGAPSGEE